MFDRTIEGVFPDQGTSNPYIQAAKEKATILSFKLHSSFFQMANFVRAYVKPVFQAVANPRQYFTDPLAGMGKGGQAPFVPAPKYGAYNGAKQIMTKIRGALRSSQLKEATKFVYS